MINKKILKWFDIYSVGRKTILITKLIAVAAILIYLGTASVPGHIREWIFVVSVVIIAFAADWIFQRVITKPLQELNAAVRQMAALNLEQRCSINSRDEFGELAENLNKLAVNLQHALRQRKELTDTLSHEMKTPLGVTRAYAEGLQDETDIEKKQEYAGVIIEETEKMAVMINELLDLSALEAGASQLWLEEFDIVELIEQCAGRFFADALPGDFRFFYRLPDKSCYVKADQVRIEQVISCFMGNARKFVSPQGVIELTVEEENSLLVFELYNDYSGTIPEVTADLWKAFYRDKSERNQDGSGLGLAISAQILEMHGFSYAACLKRNGIAFSFKIPMII